MSDFKPYKIQDEETEELRSNDFVQHFLPEGWDIYAVDQSCGTTYYDHDVMTIPTWIWNKSKGKQVWYIAHELAHAWAHIKHNHGNHGDPFMEELKKICPEEYQYHEFDYKPSNAKAAGLSKKGMEE